MPTPFHHDQQFGFVNYGPGNPSNQRRRGHVSNPPLPGSSTPTPLALGTAGGGGPSRQISPLRQEARLTEARQDARPKETNHLNTGSRRESRGPASTTKTASKSEILSDSELSELDEDEDDTDGDDSDGDDQDVEYLPGSQTPRKRKATQPPSSSPVGHRGSGGNRSSARLRDKDRRRRGSSELLEIDPSELNDEQPENSAAAALHAMSAHGNGPSHDRFGDDDNGERPKKRTYIRRDAQRRKEQNAQAQKKFRLKKKKIAEDMRVELDAAKRQIANLKAELSASQAAHAHQTSLNTAGRLTISKLNRTILGCDRCSTKKKEWEASEAEARAVIALEVAMRGEEGDESFDEDADEGEGEGEGGDAEEIGMDDEEGDCEARED